MPRFYFHLYNGSEIRDEEGTMLPNECAAREEAILSVRDIAAEQIKRAGQLYLSHRVEIENEAGETIRVRFGDCIEVNP